ncbi:ATP-binding cassette domain-containing protein [Bifidobacterium aerophilum]|uniref:ATP-binding cassette domain-containing protein n=2 Tax=Bifidobacterium aerophilum TaxID=1798155 RepID=A0A6N9Z2V8_9BIFI|nr:ATP-binding cassette domain-containing protein [Bifidobacterium aerophilum]
MRSYPSLALNKVTLTDAKTGHNTLDRVSADCYAGHIYAFKVESDDERVALLSVMTGMLRPTDGAVMNKSLNVLEIEPGELRGHRLGIVPQRYAVRDDLNAEQNVLYAMDASGRTFLKPKPVAARELLQKVGFDSETPNAAVGKLPALQQRLVAIARAISCDAEVIIADEPTGGLDADDSVVVLKTLIGLTHGDPKRCVIVITGDDEVAEVAERVIAVSE